MNLYAQNAGEKQAAQHIEGGAAAQAAGPRKDEMMDRVGDS